LKQYSIGGGIVKCSSCGSENILTYSSCYNNKG